MVTSKESVVPTLFKFGLRTATQIADAGKQLEVTALQQASSTMEGQFEGTQQISLTSSQLSEASQQTVASLQNTNQALNQLNNTAP